MELLKTALSTWRAVSRAPIFAGPSAPAADDILWLDHPDAEELIHQRTRDPELAGYARDLIRIGLTRINGVIDPASCDRLMAEFHAYCRTSPEAAAFADAYGYHSRLVNFHMTSQAARRIGLDAKVMRVLDFLFGYPATAYASLTFERGTEQAFHRDSPFFHTKPSGFFFGVWTALEDVHPDAGPLGYYPGGHRIPIDHRAIGLRYRDDPKKRERTFADYIVELAKACENAGLKKETVLLRKGDVLIWHPGLPHSGTPIADRSRSRKSIVFHYMPETMPVYAIENFFDPSTETAPLSLEYLESHGRLYHKQTPPIFQPNI